VIVYEYLRGTQIEMHERTGNERVRDGLHGQPPNRDGSNTVTAR
jgi:hypothetical protein